MLLFEGEDAIVKIDKATGKVRHSTEASDTVRGTYGDYHPRRAGPGPLRRAGRDGGLDRRGGGRGAEAVGGIQREGRRPDRRVPWTCTRARTMTSDARADQARQLPFPSARPGQHHRHLLRFRPAHHRREGPPHDAWRRPRNSTGRCARCCARSSRAWWASAPRKAWPRSWASSIPRGNRSAARRDARPAVRRRPVLQDHPVHDRPVGPRLRAGGEEEDGQGALPGAGLCRAERRGQNPQHPGPTDPSKAQPGSVRREFGQDIMVNAAHASDSPENAEREMKIIKVEDRHAFATGWTVLLCHA